MSSPSEIEPLVLGNIGNRKSVLDVGVGLGKNGYIIRMFNQPATLIGGDAFLPYLKAVKNHEIYDDLVQFDASFLPFKDSTFEVVIASEIIEHLGKSAGNVFLAQADRVASDTIIIATPNGSDLREGAQTSYGFNKWEAHKSGWVVSDFKKKGYRVLGVGLLFHHRLGKVGMF